jgi:hypothetical protein
MNEFGKRLEFLHDSLIASIMATDCRPTKEAVANAEKFIEVIGDHVFSTSSICTNSSGYIDFYWTNCEDRWVLLTVMTTGDICVVSKNPNGDAGVIFDLVNLTSYSNDRTDLLRMIEDFVAL